MPETSELAPQPVPTAPSPSRRGFMATAGAAAAAAGWALTEGGPPAPAAEPTQGKEVKVRGVTFHGEPRPRRERPTCVARISDKLVVATDEDGKVRGWDLTKDPPDPVRQFPVHGAKKASYVTVYAPSATKGLVLSAGYDGVVHITNFADPRPANYTHPGPPEVWVVALSSDGSRAASASNAGDIHLWNPADPQGPAKYAAYTLAPVGGLAFIPGRQEQVLAGHGHGEMVWWDFSKPEGDQRILHKFPHGNDHAVNALAVTPNGRYAISGGFDRTVRVWDLNNVASPPKPLHVQRDHLDDVWRVAVSPDGNWYASAGQDGNVWVRRVETGDYRAGPKHEDGGVMGVAFVTNDQVVYTSGNKNDPAVRVWNL